jgi:hypothetical protein
MRKWLILFIIISILLVGAANAKDLRAVKLKRFLARYPWSPLRGHEQEILYCADLFGIDYRLFVAVAGAESSYGKNYPKQTNNMTGYNSCDTTFVSIYQNIYETSKLIGTRNYYKKYRKTKDLMDFILVYKGVPPYSHHFKNMRCALDGITAVDIEDVRMEEAMKIANFRPKDFSQARIILAMEEPLYNWHSVRYDLYESRTDVTVSNKIAIN